MEPRGFLNTFVSSSAIAAIAGGLLMQLLLHDTQESIIFGLLFGITMGYFVAKTRHAITLHVPCQDKQQFLAKANIRLAELGYYPEQQIGDHYTYVQTGANFSAGPLSMSPIKQFKISLQFQTNEAVFTGPKDTLASLHKYFEL
ncbi:MAG TPA: hypothetical protein VJO32_12455 [Ktedonobacteraceae bacterium]|nr:hypothetical protein [Ktedonobacteraceae bacterium]